MLSIWPAPPEPERVLATDDEARRRNDHRFPPLLPIEPDDPDWLRRPEQVFQRPKPPRVTGRQTAV